MELFSPEAGPSRTRFSHLGSRLWIITSATQDGTSPLCKKKGSFLKISNDTKCQKANYYRHLQLLAFVFIVSASPTDAKSTPHGAGRLKRAIRCRANMAQIRQSRPDSRLAFQVKVLKPFEVVRSSLECGIGLHRVAGCLGLQV